MTVLKLIKLSKYLIKSICKYHLYLIIRFIKSFNTYLYYLQLHHVN